MNQQQRRNLQMPTYNKLIRDRIPEFLDRLGKTYKVETLNQDRYILELKKKLNEELMEYQEAANDKDALEELADIVELIHCLTLIHGASIEKLEQVREEKARERGSFKEKLFLIEVEGE